MPVIAGTDAPRFDIAGTHVIGLASPSRGARETCAWRLTLAPGAASPDHTLDREEVFVVLGGAARATIDGSTQDVGTGDALIVPAGAEFKIETLGVEPFEAVACLPVGGRARVGGESNVPPWAT